MDRTVPKTGSEEIELYMRTYYSLLRSTHDIQIETLVEAHKAMDSSLHVGARSVGPDVSALVYASQRLPSVMPDVSTVLLGQVEKLFIDAGYPVRDWERVTAPGRRRRMHFDGAHTLAVFIASRSDIDDLFPMLTAYQVEWNKLHGLLHSEVARLFLAQNVGRTHPLSDAERTMLALALQMEPEDVRRLEVVWGEDFTPTLTRIAENRKQISLRQIAGSLADYRRGTAYWWDDVTDYLQHEAQWPVDLRDRPVYFVSSNTHSLINLLSGFAMREEDAIVRFIEARGAGPLLDEYRSLTEKGDRFRANFLYFALRDYLRHGEPGARARRLQDERDLGISRITSQHGSDLETQVIDLRRLRPDRLDPRLAPLFDPLLAESDAVLFNVDYPLGLAAYELLNRVTENVERLLGVYVMGKAATLNGRIGDVMVANVVHDEHSSNTYLFNNCFTGEDVAPFMTYGMVLDNQKAISAPGTFLQNSRYMDVFYREGYTVIEMEAGPYLSSIYEAVRPKRHPQNEIVSLQATPFDLGFLHYASDTPFRRGHNLGAGSLEYRGIAPTYATAIAILQRIFRRESARLRAERRTEPEGVGEPVAVPT